MRSLRSPLIALAAIAAVLTTSACTGEQGDTTLPPTTAPIPSGPVIQPGTPGEPNTTLTGTAAAPVITPTVVAEDVDFYQDMIVHHSQAIVMVQTATPRLNDTQVKAIASRIADEQDPEIQMMARWLTARKQEVPPQATNPRLGGHDHDGMPGMATEAQLAALGKATGVEADRMFLTLMIAHHKGALTMVDAHTGANGDERVQEVADEIYVTQSKQIDQMQEMLDRLA